MVTSAFSSDICLLGRLLMFLRQMTNRLPRCDREGFTTEAYSVIFKWSCGVGIGDRVHSLGAVLVSCAVTTISSESISVTRKASTPAPSPRQLLSWTILGLSLKSTTYFELFLHVVSGNSLMFIFQMCV